MTEGTNEMHIIYYDIKNTSANTDYLFIQPDDMAIIQTTMFSILTYFTELSIAKNKTIKDMVTKWFTKSDNDYHYNKRLGKYNSPQSYLSGMFNNLQFGNQKDLSLVQLRTIQSIVNDAIIIIEYLEDKLGFTLQEKPVYTKIWIEENIWSVGQAT